MPIHVVACGQHDIIVYESQDLLRQADYQVVKLGLVVGDLSEVELPFCKQKPDLWVVPVKLRQLQVVGGGYTLSSSGSGLDGGGSKGCGGSLSLCLGPSFIMSSVLVVICPLPRQIWCGLRD